MNMISRRRFLTLAGASAALAVNSTILRAQSATPASVIVVGGGFAGATVAKYLRLWGGNSVTVTLVDTNLAHVSCILSNLVLNGSYKLANITFDYTALGQKYGVKFVQGRVEGIGVAGNRRSVTLTNGQTLYGDRIVLAPGIDFDPIPGLDPNKIPHAWVAGPQTTLLQQQIAAMPAGGTFVMTIPPAPYRCPARPL
jgi:sulfide dehydrogenase [flavocytochrome c] flavoprotein subunit